MEYEVIIHCKRELSSKQSEWEVPYSVDHIREQNICV